MLNGKLYFYSSFCFPVFVLIYSYIIYVNDSEDKGIFSNSRVDWTSECVMNHPQGNDDVTNVMYVHNYLLKCAIVILSYCCHE